MAQQWDHLPSWSASQKESSWHIISLTPQLPSHHTWLVIPATYRAGTQSSLQMRTLFKSIKGNINNYDSTTGLHGDCMISYCISPCFCLCPRLPPTSSLHQLSPQSFPCLLSCWSLWMDANTYPPFHTAQAARNAHLLKCQSGETHLSHPTSYLQFFYGSPQLLYKIQHP